MNAHDRPDAVEALGTVLPAHRVLRYHDLRGPRLLRPERPSYQIILGIINIGQNCSASSYTEFFARR
jgi:hypothetical protein